MTSDPIAFDFPADWEWCDAKVTYQPNWKRLGSTPGALKLAPRRAFRVTVRSETTVADLVAILTSAHAAGVRTVRIPHGGPFDAAKLGSALAKLRGVISLHLYWYRGATGWNVNLIQAGDAKVQLDLDGWTDAEVFTAVGRVRRANDLLIRTDRHPAGGFSLAPLLAVRGLKSITVRHSEHSAHTLDWTGLSGQAKLETLVVCSGLLPTGFWAEVGQLPRMRELRLDWPEAAEPAPRGALAGLRSLKRVTGSCLFNPVPEAFRALVECPAVTDLQISQFRIDDDTAAALGSMPAVRDCYLRGAELTDTGMQAMCRWPQVRSLTLFEVSDQPVPITAAGFQVIGELATLEELYLHGFDHVAAPAWAVLAALPKLRQLKLSTATPFDVLEAIGPLKRVEQLRLEHGNSIGPAGYAGLAAMKRLRALRVEVYSRQPYYVPLAEVGELRRLTRLALKGLQKMTDDQFARVGGLRDLEELVVYGAGKLTDRGVEALTRLAKVRALRLHDVPRLTDRAVAIVAALPRLDTLFIRCSTKMTDAGLAALASARRLKVLHLEFARNLTGDTLLRLARRLPLEELHVSSSPHLTDEHLLALAELPSLKRVALTECKQITADGRAAATALRPDWKQPMYNRWDAF